MTKDDIINMAMKAEFCYEMEFPYLPHCDSISVERGGRNITRELAKFANLVAAHEREACAKVCEKQGRKHDHIYAAAIRERSKHED